MIRLFTPSTVLFCVSVLVLTPEAALGDSAFALPDIKAPSLAKADPDKNFFSIFKNEAIDNSSQGLSIVNQDLAVPGRGKLPFEFTRTYSHRRWDTRKPGQVNEAYVNEVWGNPIYYGELEAAIRIGFKFSYFCTNNYQLHTDFAFYYQSANSEYKKNEYYKLIELSQSMQSMHDFRPYGEVLSGRGWDLYFNGFNRLYIIDTYKERINEESVRFADPDKTIYNYITARRMHQVMIPTSRGGMQSYYRTLSSKLCKKGPLSVGGGLSTDDPHISMNNQGMYTNGGIDDEGVVRSPVDRSQQLECIGEKYVLRTYSGVNYVFGTIQDVTNYTVDDLGGCDFELRKRVAFLEDIYDVYGNRIHIEYLDAGKGIVKHVILSTDDGGAGRKVALEYDASGKVAEAAWFENTVKLKSMRYGYVDGAMAYCEDDLSRRVKYEYYPAGAYQGMIRKVEYANRSYTEYAYATPGYVLNSLAADAMPAIRNMVFPEDGPCVMSQRRVDVNPADGATRKAITTQYDTKMHINGKIVPHGWNFHPREKANEFHFDKRTSLILETVSGGASRTLTYEYDNLQRLARVVEPVNSIRGDVVYNITRFSTNRNDLLPSAIEKFAQLGTEEIRISKEDKTYDEYDMPTMAAVTLGGNGVPYRKTVLTYITVSRDINGLTFIVRVPESMRLVDGSDGHVQRSDAEYDMYGQVTRLIKYLAGTPRTAMDFKYDDPAAPWLATQVLKHMDATRYQTVSATYDTAWRLLPKRVITSSQDGSIRFERNVDYDVLGRMTRVTDENGNITTAGYDATDRMTELLLPDGIKLAYQYQDALNMALVMTYTNGTALQTTESRVYDGYGRPLSVDVEGVDGTRAPSRSFVLDERGLVRRETFSGGGLERTTAMEYDLQGRETSKTFADGTVLTHAYDGYAFGGAGYPGLVFSEVVNQIGQVERTYQDFLGRTVRVERFKGGDKFVVTMEYNLLDKEVKRTWSPGSGQRSAAFEYDEWGRQTKAFFEYDGGMRDGVPSEVNVCSIDDRLVTKTLRDGTVKNIDYDAIGRVRSITFDGAPQDNITYTYDTAPYGKNKVASIATATGTIEYVYGPAGRLLSTKRTLKVGDKDIPYSVHNAYDGLGRQTLLLVPGLASSRAVRTVYDCQGRPTSVLLGADALAWYSYDGLGQMTGIQLGTTLATSYTNDRLGRTTQIWSRTLADGKTIFLEKYAYDGIGNRSATTFANGSTENYEYTPALSTLSKVTYPYPGAREMTYAFDEQQNRTSWKHLFGRFDYTYNGNGNLDRYFIDGDRNQNNVFVQYQYDGRGNTTGTTKNSYGRVLETVSFTYNKHNEMTGAVLRAGQGAQSRTITASYAYDHAGMRVRQTTGTNTRYYLYEDGSQRLLAELGSTGAVDKVYLHGNGTIGFIDVANSGKISYYHADVLGSPRAITDPMGKVQYAAKLGPYGEAENVVKSTRLRQSYTGKFLDEETGLYYFHARYYDPVVGRFLTVDSKRDGSNWYIYCLGNPLRFMDSTGHFVQLIQGAWQAATSPEAMAFYSWAGSQMSRFGSQVASTASRVVTAVSRSLNATVDLVRIVGEKIAQRTSPISEAVWKLNPFERGRQVEQAMRANLASNFPTFDRFINGVATSIKSLDLSAATYQNMPQLASRVRGYIDTVARFVSVGRGEFFLSSGMIRERVLELVVRGGGSPAQAKVLQDMVEYGRRMGVNVQVMVH